MLNVSNILFEQEGRLEELEICTISYGRVVNKGVQ